MKTQNLFAIATLTMALTGTVFGQSPPEIDKVKPRKPNVQSIKSPRDTASGQATGITSPRDVASGQATGKRQHKPIARQAGFMDFNNDATTTQIQPGQNSDGTLTNQRRRQPVKGYANGGVGHEDTWDNRTAKRKTAPQSHDKYANQEVSYRQTKNEVSIESLEKAKGTKPAASGVVFEPNHEPLWAKQNKRRNQAQNRAKNQDIEVENDETHRTIRRAARTETVDNNESLRTKSRRRKN